MSDSNTSKQSITDLFTSEELRDIAARASTIDERLAGGYIANNSPVSTEKEHTKRTVARNRKHETSIE